MASNQATNSSKTEVFDTLAFVGAVAKASRKSSLTRDARDSIAMYPCVMSADVQLDDAVPLARALEMHFASLLVAVISANSTYNRGRYANAMDYIKANFHNNDSIPAVLKAGIESQLPEDFKVTGISAAHVSPDASKVVSPEFVMECWLGSDLMLNSVTLNQVYRPEKMNQVTMESIVGDLRKLHTPAMEATDDYGNKLGTRRFTQAVSHPNTPMGTPTRYNVVKTTQNVPLLSKGEKDDDGNIMGAGEYQYRSKKTGIVHSVTGLKRMHVDIEHIDSNPDYELVTEKRDINQLQGVTYETGKQAIVPNQKLNGLEPTMINLQLSGEGNNSVITQNIVMGVKVMIQQVPSNVMVANLVQGVAGSRAMFSFIKWTKGQYSFLKDFILGVANAKEAAISNRDTRNWIGALKRRKQSNMLARITTGESIPPNTTVVLTSHEAALVAEQTGVDLNEPYNAIKLMNAYYFLAVVIVDTTNGGVKTIFDGDSRYNETSINAIRGKTGKNDTDLTNMVAILRAAGGLK